MSKKTLILCLSAVALLLALIGVGVSRLYSEKPGSLASEAVSHDDLLRAVPSDAAAILCFRNARSGIALLDDPSNCLRTLLGSHPAFGRFLSTLPDSVSLKGQPLALSVHYAQTLVPLMALEAHPAGDTTALERRVVDYAVACGLSARLQKGEDYGFVLVSPSGTLVESSCRHLDSGTSVLDDTYFAELSSQLSAREVLFLSHEYLGKLTAALCQRPLYPAATFLKGSAEWSCWEVRSSDGKHLRLSGKTVSGASPGYYANLLEGLPAGEMKWPEQAPACAVSVLSLSLPDPSAYLKAYEKWLDASQSLQTFRRGCEELRTRTGEDPLRFLEAAGIREAAKVRWVSDSLQDPCVLLLRRSKPAKTDAPAAPFDRWEFPGLLLGSAFAAPGPLCRIQGSWLILGSESSLAEWERLMAEKGTLLAALGDVGESRLVPSKGAKALFYASASDAAPRYAEWFREPLSSALRLSCEGVIRLPMVLAWGEGGLSFEAARPSDFSQKKSSASASTGRKADVEVPAGPFEVTNCATGKTNLFYQAPNLSLCLKDKESGKGLWGVSFDQPLCGAVCEIDYYANGKLQFLFAAGSRLYLIDRLGRFVSGFPVELGKDVLLGPAAYDFSGAKGYTVLVLHRDNTIGMYDLHGVQPSSWKGIACPDSILSLPVLASADGKRVWVVKTAGGERIYDFWGGEPLKAKSIKKLEY